GKRLGEQRQHHQHQHHADADAEQQHPAQLPRRVIIERRSCSMRCAMPLFEYFGKVEPVPGTTSTTPKIGLNAFCAAVWPTAERNCETRFAYSAPSRSSSKRTDVTGWPVGSFRPYCGASGG